MEHYEFEASYTSAYDTRVERGGVVHVRGGDSLKRVLAVGFGLSPAKQAQAESLIEVSFLRQIDGVEGHGVSFVEHPAWTATR
jgi:hypothetical protein